MGLISGIPSPQTEFDVARQTRQGHVQQSVRPKNRLRLAINRGTGGCEASKYTRLRYAKACLAEDVD